MDITLTSITIDCEDSAALAEFWHTALGWEIVHNSPEGAYLVNAGTGPGLFFQPVPEPKVAKNRAHIDLTSGAFDEDLARLQGLGATVQRDDAAPDGRQYVVLADPEGNEFCLITKSDA
jgi:predicted enzyme related to lactoylglutathione lyase